MVSRTSRHRIHSHGDGQLLIWRKVVWEIYVEVTTSIFNSRDIFVPEAVGFFDQVVFGGHCGRVGVVWERLGGECALIAVYVPKNKSCIVVILLTRSDKDTRHSRVTGFAGNRRNPRPDDARNSMHVVCSIEQASYTSFHLPPSSVIPTLRFSSSEMRPA